MVAPIVKPEVPYNGEIPGGLESGRMCRIQGVTHPEADRFNINFQVGPNDSPRDDTALHISVRLNQGYIARNSYQDGEWGNEQGNLDLPIGTAQSWEIIILVDHNDYKVAINGQHFCEFPHRIPINKVTHLLIDGDVSITLISWEGIAGVGGTESASRTSALNAEGPQGAPQQFGGYGGPQQGYGAPPQGYGAPPQGYGGYGAPGNGYGAPQPGYGPPPPPGAQPETGFDNFLDTAQTILAGAIKSGAAEKLLGGLLSGGGNQSAQQGYAPQNAKYGIYPDLPKDFDPNQETHTKTKSGPVESLFSSFLSGGNTQQQGSQQSNQGIDLGSVLSGLLGGNRQGNTNPSQPGAVPPQYSGPQQYGGPQQNIPPNQQSHGPDIGTFLSGLLSGANQNSGQVPPSQQQQNIHGNQQSQGVDMGSLLSGLLSGGGNQQPGQAPSNKTAAPQFQQNASGAQQSQGVDIGSLLTGLLSGGNQQQHGQVPHPQQVPPAQQGANPNQQSQGLDVGSLLSNLLSSNAHQAPQGQGGKPNASGTQQSQNIDVGALLTGLSGMLSTVQTRPIQETGGNGTPQQQAQHQQSQGGIDLSSLLSGLLSGGQSNQAPQGRPLGPYQPPTGGYNQNQAGGYQQPQAGGYQQPQAGGYQQPQAGGYQQPGGTAPSTGGTPAAQTGGTVSQGSTVIPQGGTTAPQDDTTAPQGDFTAPQGGSAAPHGGSAAPQGGTASGQGVAPKASQGASKQGYEDVSDQLAQMIAGDGGNSQRQQVGQSHQGRSQEQYGQYPHPPQEQKGPIENLLSGFLGGGGQQSHQQSHPQFGGGESIGGLGSMGGLLQNFAGNILNPKDGNQRQNY
ncbi:hypothetical protein JTB14_030135 [Gonioctena quinquepunctata]|nr:hypothetical protein JTB14_030135 [Gonioctena quinquepunctata]